MCECQRYMYYQLRAELLINGSPHSKQREGIFSPYILNDWIECEHTIKCPFVFAKSKLFFMIVLNLCFQPLTNSVITQNYYEIQKGKFPVKLLRSTLGPA